MSKIYNIKIINLSLCFIYSCLIVFFIPQLPLAFTAVLALLCVWNLYLTLSKKVKPNAWLANFLAAMSLVLMFYSVGLTDTVVLFVAMLLLSSIFKLLQATTKAHYHVIITLSFFSLSAVYLFNQSLLTTLVVSVLYILNFALLSLLESTHNLKIASKQSGKLLLLALPLAVFLLLFLPKMPAFWQLPGPKHAKTGLSEQVDPFDIAKLSNSDELVFRAQFNTSAPQSPLYWRAIIHDDFNGNAWLTSNYLKQNNTTTRFKAENNHIQAQYSIISEPAAQPWLYGLHYATSNSDGVENSALGILRKTANSAKSIQYVATSFLVTEPELTAWQASHYTQLNDANNTKTNALADHLKQQVSSDKQFYTALLDHFAVKKFSYTLTPQPMTGDDTLDQFMFEQQRGFCGHYASAAAYMFRRAGIPARVVSGYLGGEFNSKSNTLSVRQYDAHAWVEVYLPSQGWQVFDATAVVAPERLTGSLSENDQLNAEFKHNLGFGLLSLSDVAAINWLRLQLENLDYQWSSWVLGFDKQKQSDFLKTLFGNQNTWLVPLVVLIVLVLSLSAYFIYLTWARPAKQLAPMVKEYRQIVKWANKLQLFPAHPLTPVQQLHFFAREIPEAEQQLHQFSLLFNQVRYENKPFNKDRKSQAKDLIKLIKSKKQRNL